MPEFADEAERLRRAADWRGLETLAHRWTLAEPANATAWQAVSRAAYESGRFHTSLMAWRRALDLAGATPSGLVVLARIALHALEFDIARAALDEAAPASAESPEYHAARALLLTYFGRFDEAEASCRRCLAQAPEYIPAYTVLGRLTDGRFSDREMDVLHRVAFHDRAPADFRIPASFALAHGFDARGDVARAFGALSLAHALAIERNRREGRRYDRAAQEARVERLMAHFPGVPATALPAGASGPMPIFIVGMPRSGTTLVESVLTAHSRVRGGGERPHLQEILRECLEWPDDALVPGAARTEMHRRWRDAYLSGLDPSAGYITDKHPLNFEATGLVALLFPAAPILHVRRSPVETCFSIYRNEFSKFWTFADRLEDLGHFYGQYARLAAHWAHVLGSRLHTVQYEEFAGDFDSGAPALVAACGLPWEERCRRFQRVDRPVATFSAVSARGPVRVRTNASAAYRPLLEPLIAALADAGCDPATGALRNG